MPEEDARRLADAQALMAKLDGIDALFTEARATRDYHERLGAAAVKTVEDNVATVHHAYRLLRLITAVVAAGLLLWTPVVAWGAVWFHEEVRNNCYPAWAVATGQVVPGSDHWYCHIFPGAGPDAH